MIEKREGHVGGGGCASHSAAGAVVMATSVGAEPPDSQTACCGAGVPCDPTGKSSRPCNTGRPCRWAGAGGRAGVAIPGGRSSHDRDGPVRGLVADLTRVQVVDLLLHLGFHLLRDSGEPAFGVLLDRGGTQCGHIIEDLGGAGETRRGGAAGKGLVLFCTRGGGVDWHGGAGHRGMVSLPDAQQLPGAAQRRRRQGRAWAEGAEGVPGNAEWSDLLTIAHFCGSNMGGAKAGRQYLHTGSWCDAKRQVAPSACVSLRLRPVNREPGSTPRSSTPRFLFCPRHRHCAARRSLQKRQV